MSDFLNRMKSAAKADLKTIVLPEGEDPRTIVAATKIIEEGLAKIVILGNPDEIDVPGLQAMFAHGFEALDDISGAKVGDKTMMDALIPASQAIAAYTGQDESELFTLAAQAAHDGSEATKQFTAKFGRAKSYGEQTIGTPDAGATSMALFFQGLAQS